MSQTLPRLNYRRLALYLLLTVILAVILICVNRSPSQVVDLRTFTAYTAQMAAIVVFSASAAEWPKSNLSIRWGMLLVFLGTLLLNGSALVLLRGGLTMPGLVVFSGLSALCALAFAWSVSRKRRSDTERRAITRSGSPENHALS